LAATLFKWNHGKTLRNKGIPLFCHTQDALAVLPQLLDQHPNAVVFFDNLLGQLRFTCNNLDAAEKKLKQVRSDLVGRNWGSLHDRMSGAIEQIHTQPRLVSPFHTAGHLKKDSEIQAWLNQINAKSPWLDHLTQDVFPDEAEVANITWAFNQTYWHWLQMGWVRG
jgi:deoxyribodipyrimidine photolyase